MFARQSAACPFCFSEDLRVGLLGNDDPDSDADTFVKALHIACGKCGKRLFSVGLYRGHDQLRVAGVSVCEKCEEHLRREHNGWREEDIPKVVYECKTSACPECGSPLRPVWWRGWNYRI